MIRIQIYCATCKQYVDANVVARKGRAIVAAFEDSHALEACYQEDLDGQDQEGSGGDKADDRSAAPAEEPAETAPSGRAH